MEARIDALDFSILSPEMIKKMARVRVVNSDLYDADGYPVEGGVMDPRLGVIDPGLHCRTCGGSIGKCPGHFGYLELARPVIHVLYTKVIYRLLKFTCRKCNRLMVLTEDVLRKNVAPTKCPHCKAKQKKIKLVKPYSFYEGKKEMSSLDVRERFEKIPDADLKKIGVKGGRPEWLILTLFPVSPATMRPSITLESGERSEDDLTHKLVDIVRINQSLKENIDIGAPDFILKDLWELVQYHISTYFDNQLTGTPLARHRSGRPLKALIQRIKAKEGRIRGNLLGKRVNFSARTVIIPDPKISINEVGVPETIAKELTVPIYVTDFNRKDVKSMIREGRINYMVRPDGRRIKVTDENTKEITKNMGTGWIADRQLEDGDITIFNRQPSLHRMSMMAHRVKVMPYQSFRLNPSVCPPYNADFDGDEMNLHVMQTEEARAEASALMEVQHNIISPRFGGPIIGCDLDQISGLYMLTQKDVVFSRKDAVQLLSNAGIFLDVPEKDKITGKELFGLLLPDDINLEFEANFAKKIDSMEEKKKMDGWVVIKDGKLVEGRIDSAAVGVGDGFILSRLMKKAGKDAVKEFINNTGRLGNAYMVYRGFSVGTSDLDVSRSVRKKIKKELKAAKNKADKFITKFEKGKIKVLPGMSKKRSLEAQVTNALSTGISKISDIVENNLVENDVINMAKSGAKGSLVNITQMAAVVGQETILGQRISRGYLHRTLPHVNKNELSPISRGFVSSGFKDGLTPIELFWNIMNGREGLMDKSLRTRKSGYMQRRLVNALQDLKVMNDLSVRNSVGEIIQFKAGEDGVDPTKSDKGEVLWKEL